jgi:hypothetical protein
MLADDGDEILTSGCRSLRRGCMHRALELH